MNASFPTQLFLFCNPVFFEAGLDMRKSSKREPKFPGKEKEKLLVIWVIWKILIRNMQVMNSLQGEFLRSSVF